MTEPQAGADPAEFTCVARREGEEWVINGEKWFASHARFSAFLLVMVVTDTEAPIHRGASIVLVEQGTPGMEIVRNSAVGPYVEQGDGVHALHPASPIAGCPPRISWARRARAF